MARIAIVDDHQLSRLFASRAMGQGGHDLQVITPGSVFQALEALLKDPPDLVLLDLLMPDCPGHGLLRAIRGRQELAHLPVIIVTASRDAELLGAVQRLDIQGCLLKPVAPEALVEAVEAALAAP